MIKSFCFNSVNGDRKYKAEDFRDYFSKFISNGIFPNPSDNLQVMSGEGTSVILKPGPAFINGILMENTDDYTLEIETADGNLNRIDRIVVRLDWAKREIYPTVKKGELASNPTAPNLQRDADAYELSLADITISKGAISITQADIRDTRPDNNLCGIVHAVVDKIDVTTLFNQYEASLSQKESGFEQQFLQWFESIQDILSGDVAGNLLNEINKKMDKIVVDAGTNPDYAGLEYNFVVVDGRPYLEVVNNG